jgi:hypothetical protein
MSQSHRPPFSEILQAIPGFFGIRLEEEPEFDVIDEVGDVEVRSYRPAVLAQVTVGGDHDSAMQAAFEKLADYIFGGNRAAQAMSMTTPVLQQHRGDAADGETMSMTTPVLQSQAGDGWTVSFFLSNALTIEEAPQPNDPSITLVQQPESIIGALRYTGNNTDERRERARKELLDAFSGSARWRVREGVSWAQYDQPFAIPFLKRNEAHVALEQIA